jgi:hypothetical protein
MLGRQEPLRGTTRKGGLIYPRSAEPSPSSSFLTPTARLLNNGVPTPTSSASSVDLKIQITSCALELLEEADKVLQRSTEAVD